LKLFNIFFIPRSNLIQNLTIIIVEREIIMNLIVTLGNAATSLVPASIVDSYASAYVDRVKATHTLGGTVDPMSRLANIEPDLLWRHIWPNAARFADKFIPAGAFSAGAQQVHGHLIFKGLMTAMMTGSVPESQIDISSAAFAIDTMGERYVEEAVRALVLRGDEPLERMMLIGDSIVPVLRRIIIEDESDHLSRISAARVLIEMNTVGSLTVITELLQSGTEDVRSLVAKYRDNPKPIRMKDL
jgi:hypothetical protein